MGSWKFEITKMVPFLLAVLERLDSENMNATYNSGVMFPRADYGAEVQQ